MNDESPQNTNEKSRMAYQMVSILLLDSAIHPRFIFPVYLHRIENS